ncbi:recombinase family protein [Coleofasciculus sp. FACHB-129]|uniref:recombinase family protein n=1 Tax=Cyanophyceae TaxID=3028117 RepID=UPI0016830B0D|nr:recombinase family protein [Coleofasciculus sp. FACHB-129]MBD1894366.1 recombinase family protein [Coleofasciculus sp. FACHB-129]
MGQIKLRKSVIYCRVSTGEQDCDRQEKDLLAYAARASFEVIKIFRESASGSKDDRPERRKVLALAQARKIDAILVTELTRWGRSTIDLITTLQELQSRKVSLIAQTGLEFDLSTPQGKLIATLMSGLAEFERDLIKERVRSGMAAAKSRGQKFGRQPGYIPALVREKESKVLELIQQGLSYRKVAESLGLSKNTVMRIVRDSREALPNQK